MADRLEVLKTYKTYVNGAFPRSESGRTYRIEDKSGTHIANACRCTRKDVRDSMVAARGAVKGWSSRSAYNRGQILYRIAEMLEGRSVQFIDELVSLGSSKKEAKNEVESSVDRLVYYAGWTDKISQVFGSVNPVASSHFNFSNPEPTGVIGIMAPDESPLLGLVSLISPIIAGGNTCVVLSSESHPLSAVSFGEVLHASDVPAGVVNILTGYREEMANALTSHMDLNAILNSVDDMELRKQTDENAAISVKRVKHYAPSDWSSDQHETPYLMLDFMEIKTTWHPVGA
jgi:acyl-CoA reductase-like NAD-dependent aldehyde dehydrogenase